MNRLARAIRDHAAREIFRKRQVRAARYVRPFGLKKGIAKLGACGQEVDGDRLADIDPGAAVLVINDGASRAIISAPPRGAGPSSAVTRKLRTELPVIETGFYVLYGDGNDWFFIRHDRATGDAVEVVGVDVPYTEMDTGGLSINSPTATFGKVSRLSIAYPEPVLERSTAMKVIDFMTDARYSHSVEAGWYCTAPACIGDNLYWVEFENMPTDTTKLTCRLMRSELDLSDVTTMRQENAVTLPGSPVSQEWTKSHGPNFVFDKFLCFLYHPDHNTPPVGQTYQMVTVSFDIDGGGFDLGADFTMTSVSGSVRAESGHRAGVAFSNSLMVRPLSSNDAEFVFRSLGEWNGDPFHSGVGNDVCESVTPSIKAIPPLAYDPSFNTFWATGSSAHSSDFTEFSQASAVASNTPRGSTAGVRTTTEFRNLVVV